MKKKLTFVSFFFFFLFIAFHTALAEPYCDDCDSSWTEERMLQDTLPTGCPYTVYYKFRQNFNCSSNNSITISKIYYSPSIECTSISYMEYLRKALKRLIYEFYLEYYGGVAQFHIVTYTPSCWDTVITGSLSRLLPCSDTLCCIDVHYVHSHKESLRISWSEDVYSDPPNDCDQLDSLGGCDFVCDSIHTSPNDSLGGLVPPLPLSDIEIHEFKSGFKFFPNPANSTLSIIPGVQENGKMSVMIYNSMGLLQNEYTFEYIPEKLYELDIEHLPTGFYYLRIIINQKEYIQYKFIKN